MPNPRQKKKPPRETFAEQGDRLSGIVRDKTTGIVLTRSQRHPLADLFMSAPMGPGNLPGMNIPYEAHHILAIHVFDNLDCSPPRNPLYKFRRNLEQERSTGIPGALWVPVNTPDKEYEPVADEVVEVVDITDYTPMQIEAMKAQIREKEIRDKLTANLDPHVRGDAV